MKKKLVRYELYLKGAFLLSPEPLLAVHPGRRLTFDETIELYCAYDEGQLEREAEWVIHDTAVSLLSVAEKLKEHLASSNAAMCARAALLLQSYFNLLIIADGPAQNEEVGRERKKTSRVHIRKINKQRASEARQREKAIAEDSKRLRRDDYSTRDVAGILAKKHRVSATTIRRAEKKAGIR